MYELISIFTTLTTIIAGGGWFISYRAYKRKVEGEAKQAEADANKSAQEYYNTTLRDINNTLNEVRAERDHYKEDRNALRVENDEMRKKYKELEEQVTALDLNYKRDVARLGRRLDCISPFLCGTAGCLHRTKVTLMENIDDNSFTTEDEQTNRVEQNKEETT